VQKISTGGSTGSPVTVLVDAARAAFTDAARIRAQRWLGVDFGEREIVLWGSPIELTKQDRVRRIRDWLINSRLLSAFDLSENALARYADCLHRFRPQKLYGYASAIALLAGYLKRTGREPGPGWPRAVFTTAEPLFDFQRDLIEEVFHCPVAVEYGARDAGLIAHECPHRKLHLNAEGILVEIVGEKGANQDGRGEIVVTNLQSYAMPLIRYRTGDVGKLEAAPCPCGRGLPVLGRVEGRRTDFLVAADGRVLHALAIIYVLREMLSVKEFQVVQESLHRIVIRVVPEPVFSDFERTMIVRKAKLLLGEDVEVVIQPLSKIERLPSGKFRYVISQVADAYLERMLPGSGVETGRV
jgi:phenylacetate-CoA ligase